MILRDSLKTEKEALKYMDTGDCPFREPDCPEDLVDLDSPVDTICKLCIERYFQEEH